MACKHFDDICYVRDNSDVWFLDKRSHCSFVQVDLSEVVMLIAHFTCSFLTVFSGSFESEEASHLECDHCQCHLWSLLDYWFIDLHLKLLWYLHVWSCLLRHFRHHVYVQFCYQPFCIFSVEWTVQREATGNVLLQVFNQSTTFEPALQRATS